MRALLEIEGVSRRFGGLHALSDVSFTVGEGEIVSVIGPNGAGKTTLFNVISGVLPPSAGDIRFEGRSLVRLAPHKIAAAGIGRTYQVVRPFVRLNVVDNVAVGALVHERGIERARRAAYEILELVGLGPLAEYPASSLTLTQRKRLEVARALATRPKILLLDEVMAGLNPTEIDATCAFILSLRERGIAAVGAIEHVMRVVMNISHRIVVLNFGKKIAEGTPAEISTHPDVVAAYFGTSLGVMSAILSIRDIHVGYGAFMALHGVSLEVEEGEIVTIVGANGAGKSTTLRAVAGLNPPRSGEIHFEGERVDGLSPRGLVERGIALSPEGRQLFPEMTVEENLLVGTEARGRAQSRANLQRMYERLPILAERRGQLAGTLSGGEQQMAAIARALMSEPRLLLLDEPSLGLAPVIVAGIFAWVSEINRAGTTVVLVEQNVAQSLRLATRAYVLAEGRVALHGQAADIAEDAEVQRAYLGQGAPGR